MLEIERKFLIRSEAYKMAATSEERIIQGFLNTHAERTVRVRVKDNLGYLTIKGKSNEVGTTRFEWEKKIDIEDAEALLVLCEKPILEKTRYKIPVGKHIFEVDEFYGANKGLIVAEVELTAEDEKFEKPDWLGDEVTGKVKYYNSQLIKNPFSEW